MEDTSTLYHELTDRLDTANVAGPVANLILAAFQGEEVLAAALRGEALPAMRPEHAAEGELPEVFLESVEVTGFRGIGPTAAVRLKPQPGLTVVAGRNGSGKSTFAESIEYALTEDSPRWSQRPPAFRDGWRNLHHDGDRELAVKLRLGAGGPPVAVRRSWPADATELTCATVSTTQGSDAMPSGVLPAWVGAADRFRPFLSARDLERVISARPAELYDAIAPILGLAPLSVTDARLNAERKKRDDRVKALKAAFSGLVTALGALEDPRAAEAVRLLGARAAKAKLVELAELAGGETGGGDTRAASATRRLAEYEMPDSAHTLREVAEAAAVMEHLAGTEVAITQRMAELLRGALEMHEESGDRPCPVCGVGTLDSAWRDGAEQEVQRLRTATEALRTARERHRTLSRHVQEQLDDVRRTLKPIAEALAVPLPEESGVLLDALASLTVDAPDNWKAVATARSCLGSAADEWLTRRHDLWREPGAAIRRWVEDAAVVRAEADELTQLTKARSELAKVTDVMRTERFRAAAGQSEHIWQLLRQESNVEVGEIKLGGTNTRRHVEISVAVDGTRTPGLAVMSQGELHAFGLALFLPRACAEQSPYRFVVIDDPVQSMDPAKVDGLAEVLREVAQTRQVVVFTHDDRLPEAIRRLDVPADIWEVARREGSVVEVRRSSDPANRYLDDARAIAKADIPEQAKVLTVAGFCRSALEAVAMDRYRREQYAADASRHDIEAALNAAHTVHDRLTLGVFGDLRRSRDLYGYLNRIGVPRAVETVKAVAKAVHGHCDMATTDMVATSTALVARLR